MQHKMNEQGITLQTTIVTAVLALAAAAAGIVIYNVVSDETEEISENAIVADGVDRFWEAGDDGGDGGPADPPDDNGDPPQTEQDACEDVAIGGTWDTASSMCECPVSGADWTWVSGSSGSCDCPTGEIEKDGACIAATTTNEYDTRHVYVGAEHSCAVVGGIGMEGVFVISETIDNSDDSVTDRTHSKFQCWGRDRGSSKLITSIASHSATPMVNDNQGSDQFKMLHAGVRNTCYITSTDTLKCLGKGTNQQLGRSPGSNSNEPLLIPSTTGTGELTGVKFVTAAFEVYLCHSFKRAKRRRCLLFGKE